MCVLPLLQELGVNDEGHPNACASPLVHLLGDFPLHPSLLKSMYVCQDFCLYVDVRVYVFFLIPCHWEL
jgi:hypothetical protein